MNPAADAPALDTPRDPDLDRALDASAGAPLAAPALGGPAVPPDTEDAGARAPRMARTALVLGGSGSAPERAVITTASYCSSSTLRPPSSRSISAP